MLEQFFPPNVPWGGALPHGRTRRVRAELAGFGYTFVSPDSPSSSLVKPRKLPRFEMSQPGNILRIFEPGGRFQPEIGIPERMEEPGRPRTRLSIRGLGTGNRTDPVLVSLNKTRLFAPTLNLRRGGRLL